jgi:galactokinase
VVVASDVPIGAGLASSGALSVALARIAGAGDEPLALADAARAAEERVTGVPCGLMDQLAGAAGRPRQALLIDCRARAFRHVPLPEDAAVVVVDSGIRRSLSDGRYAERRAACERAAALLGVATLRDATEAEAAHLPEARHVVSENARVAAMVAALGAGDLRAAGEVMCDGHRSLRDDLRVSTPELDDLVERLVRAGAHGARLTGAGFGGCVVALAGRETAADMLGRAGLVAVTTC